jgi:plastocyanin
MAFHVDGDPSPNPVVRVRPGEHVRFVLRNEATGFEHDLAIPALGLALPPTAAGEARAASIRIPATPGGFPYVCRPHAQMMRGTLVVAHR